MTSLDLALDLNKLFFHLKQTTTNSDLRMKLLSFCSSREKAARFLRVSKATWKSDKILLALRKTQASLSAWTWLANKAQREMKALFAPNPFIFGLRCLLGLCWGGHLNSLSLAKSAVHCGVQRARLFALFLVFSSPLSLFRLFVMTWRSPFEASCPVCFPQLSARRSRLPFHSRAAPLGDRKWFWNPIYRAFQTGGKGGGSNHGA